MSDSFADLWASTTPSKPPTLASTSRPNTVPTSAQPVKQNPTYGKPDLFALLSSSSSNTPSGSATPRHATASGRSTPSMLGVQRSGSAASARGGGGGDAFSDLFAGSAAGANGAKNMTLAARLALEKQQQQQLNSGRSSSAGSGGGNNEVWVGLDSLGGLGAPNGNSPKVTAEDDNDWGLGDFGAGSKPTSSRVARSTTNPTEALWDIDDFPSTTTNSSTPSVPKTTNGTTQSTTLWDINEFTSPPRPPVPTSKATTQPTAKTLWDLDGFASPSPTPPSLHPTAPQPSRSSSSSNGKHKANATFQQTEQVNTPDEDFDFGTREDRGLLDLDDDDDLEDRGQRKGKDNRMLEDDDDILGMLSKPVEAVRASTRQKTPPPATSSQPPNATARPPPSPPPHILGQIVEMGFSVAQARKALSTTQDGMDVQAALESLLNGGGSNGSGEEREREFHPPPPQRRVPSSTRDESPSITTTPRRAAPKGYKERERERERLRMQRGENSANDSLSVTEIQLQADKLVSQASEIGLSVFSKASAFWKEGKGKVVRAYEERAGVGLGAGESARRGDGRPKWMTQEVVAPEEEEEDRTSFADRVGNVRDAQPSSSVVDDEQVDLFSSAPSNPKPTAAPQPPVTQSRTQKRTRTRNLPSATPDTLSTAHAHKTTGTQAFKLGQYAAASEAYGLAISVLPSYHLLLLPLYTNRALARLKTGEYAGAVDDCSSALSIITSGEGSSSASSSWTPGSEEEDPRVLERGNDGGWTHPQGLGVDLCDQYVKSLKRRALVLEGREKWEEAGRDWEVLAGMRVEWVGEKTKGEAVMGAGRCRRTTTSTSDTSGSATPAVKPRPKPRAKPPPTSTSSNSSTSTPAPSAALTALQSQNAQAEADLTLQYSLKDGIDARLSTWRKGKETNIRALLASLDAVLWAEVLRGVKVGGMAELVSPVQVKKAYVRAIGRVHPDKLNASNSTVEQRMLANGVFGTLNEAWIAFQAGQK
ncbi:hypothetical protein M413DRAFT_444674 [Hebeloma cylindrosporum]|uniref:UBA domain-containing protein n=1 Tax=Hebeloma cylindrosporum TaxID=76867 RepID=A0A0C2XX68_HEBCY|nr:hypothetical protein M413DRAFT_444674 [Hebeloma cylindrosporum h7]